MKNLWFSLFYILVVFGSVAHTELLALFHMKVEIPKAYATGMFVGGIISSNTTWTLINSPYLLTGHILVLENVTLIIEAGVEIKLDGHFIQVDGIFQALGEPGRPIRITDTVNTGESKIVFTPTSIAWNESSQTGSVVKNTCIEGETHATSLLMISGASPKITESNLTNTNPSGSVISISEGGAPSIFSSKIRGHIGIIVWQGAPQILENVFKGPWEDKLSGYGIQLRSVSGTINIKRNLITEYEFGLTITEGTNPIFIVANSITKNEIGIIMHFSELSKPVTLNIFDNSIYNNTWNAWAWDDVNMTRNWWGTTDTQVIKAKLYDYTQDFRKGHILYEPFLNEPHTDTLRILSCSVSSSELTIGKSITVSGSISPVVSNANITLTFKKPDSSTFTRTVTTGSAGNYSDIYTPDMVGSWSVKADWEGDSMYAVATSTSKFFTVSKISSTISCTVSSSSLDIGSSITISGSISPAHSRATVVISCKRDGSWSRLTTVTSGSDGSFSYSWTPPSTGLYQLMSSWDGDSSYSEANSSAVPVTVTKISTTISCSVSPSEVTEGSSVTISGSISPEIPGATATLTYRKPDATTFTRTAMTGSGGSYSDINKPDATGSWSVSASWAGDSTHEGASSLSMSFTVKKSGCLIATATYGSELNPHVQFLREFRDNTVLSTFAGSSFMTVFNGFYYSFSPRVASTISDNRVLREVMKVVLYPLIGILHSSSLAFSLFSFSPELGVVMAGLVASSLIAVVYVMPWVLLLSFLKKFRPSTKMIRLTGLVWAGSIVVIALARATMSPPLMMAATGAFVLVTICLTILSATKTVMERHIS